jgi:A/G-specific adenine glycosylase
VGRQVPARKQRRRGQTATAVTLPAIARPLLRWYARSKRDLPWRESADPYRVWVSEIMLQQTQVERVREYFVRFVARFPTVHDLAAAREHEVLRHWEGLGYYRRARQLHAAAQRIVADHDGQFPRTIAGLMALPGIGRYTAGAIASIAFDVSAPIVEANSRRVFARLVGHDRPLGGVAGDAPIWEIAARLVPQRGAGRFNQAVMDLGAMRCTPDRPLCTRCPLADMCAAHRTGRTAAIPVTAPRRATTVIRETAVVIRHGDRVLVERRGAGEWWEGLWDFPREPSAGRRRGVTLGVVSYTVTHHKVTCTVVARTAAGGTGATAQRWVTLRQLAALPLSSPGRRIATLVVSSGSH